MRTFSIMLPVILIITGNFLICNLHAQSFSIEESEEGIAIREGEQNVLFYQKKTKSKDGQYPRSNYVHPLYGLNEEVLTEDFPEDHLHHRGVFWAWHQIVHNGKRIADGWTMENIAWNVEGVAIDKKKKQVSLKTTVVWQTHMNEALPDTIVLENTEITVYKSTSQLRMIDFKIELIALKDSLKIGGSEDDKGYGGFSARLKLPEDIHFIAQGNEITPKKTAVAAGPWMDFYGSFNGIGEPKSGVTIFSHPDNPCHPQPWILRQEKSMQNVVYPGRDAAYLPTEEGLILKYRLVIHSDDIDQKSLGELYKQYTKN